MNKQNTIDKADILIVDDRAENLRLLAVMLAAQGYEIRTAISGKLCIKAVNVLPPDLVLLDINMPEMNGYQVCQHLKSNLATKDIPVIFLSALNEPLDKVKAFEVGGNDYITKPFQLEEVCIRIKNQLKISTLQTQLAIQKKELEIKNKRLEREIEFRLQAENKLLSINQQLQILATIDSLTQLANRHAFDQFLNQEWLRMRREKAPIGIILCDVDHFKLYNDYFGHPAGDKCLQKVARAINQVVKRPADLVARYGGEEFAVILPNTDSHGVLIVAEMIRQQVENLQIEHPQSLTADCVTLSLGIACKIPCQNSRPEELIHLADCALYEAKQKGRNQVFFQLE